MTRTPWVGQPYPLGATYDGSGTNFSLFTTVAEGVELCLLGDQPRRRSGRRTGLDEERIELHEVDGNCWHTYLPDVRCAAHVPLGLVGDPWILPSKLRPATRHGDPWLVRLDTSLGNASGSRVPADATLTLLQRSIVVLRSRRGGHVQ